MNIVKIIRSDVENRRRPVRAALALEGLEQRTVL